MARSKRDHRYRDFVSRIDIDAFIETTGVLGVHDVGENKYGETELIGQCPDPWSLHKHGDTTGKFALNTERKVYNCFVCGGGSLLDLTMALLDLDPDQATDFLYELADPEREISDERFIDEMEALLAQLSPKRAEEEKLPFYNPRVLDKWPVATRDLFEWNEGEFDGKRKDIDWLTLERAGVRFAPNAIKHAPRDKRTGMPLETPYEGPSVIFPHYVEERLVGWQHRWLEDDRPKWCAKYTNTPDFPKRSTLYRPRAPQFRHTHLPTVVVESGPTALYVVGLGWPCLATFGATVTPEQLKLLRRFQCGLIFAPDNDKAGIKGVVQMADYLDGFIPLSFIYPEGSDGDDLLDRGRDGDDVLELIRTAERIS